MPRQRTGTGNSILTAASQTGAAPLRQQLPAYPARITLGGSDSCGE